MEYSIREVTGCGVMLHLHKPRGMSVILSMIWGSVILVHKLKVIACTFF